MEQDSKKNSKLGLIISIVILSLIIIFIVLIKLDVGKLGTSVLGPKLKNIPVINLILPPMPEESVDGVDYNFRTIGEAIEKLKETEEILKEKEIEAEKLNETLNLQGEEIERLKVFEQNQVKYKADKDAFDLLVAEQAGAENFMTYVESVYPDNALSIYESLTKEKLYTEDVLEMATIYQEMKPEKAAAILEQTSKIDMDMVSQLLKNVDSKQAGAILSAMNPQVADKISRYMYPTK